jgi:hypothetical protein
MDVTATLEAPCAPATLGAWVDDLGRYPQWLTIVTRADAVGDDPSGPAWSIDLRGKIGPLARSKRLRMVRTVNEDGRTVFERREADGRMHSDWVLTVEVVPTATGSHLTMRLHYGGTLWGPVLEHLLGDEIETSKPRLLRLVAS